MTWSILTGDCIEQMRTLDDESVHCCVTSPPYFGLRDYGIDGQLGLEASPDEFVTATVAVFREVRRVLRADGTLWLNIGDSFNSGAAARREPGRGTYGKHDWMGGSTVRAVAPDLKPKDLIGIPWMLAFALRADGWYLRRDIIWAKPNPMPESVTDRPTSAHEYLFLLTKSPRYFYDAEAIREPDKGRDHPRSILVGQPSLDPSNGALPPHTGLRTPEGRDGLGRNKRSVWTIASRPFPDAHFATFPSDLVEPCIKAGTPMAACSECGAPWRRITESVFVPQQDVAETAALTRSPDGLDASSGWAGTPRGRTDRRTLGFEPTCPHGTPPSASTVLDPFCGAGTTGLVATQLGRDFVGVELNPEYVALGEDRIRRWEADPAGQLKPHAPIDGQGSLLSDSPTAEMPDRSTA